MDREPTSGRIVHYVLPVGRYAGEHRPAIIVATAEGRGWGYPPEEEVVQLCVFLDGPNDSAVLSLDVTPEQMHGEPALPIGVGWVTSVRHSEGQEPGTWHWPEF